MEYNNIHNVICFAGLKHAALYFDHVIPVSFRSMQGGDFDFEVPELIPGFAFSHVVFGEDQPTGNNIGRHAARFLDGWDRFIKAIGPSRQTTIKSSRVDDYADVQQMYLDDVTLPDGSSVRNVFHVFARELGVDYASVQLDKPTSDEGFEYTALTLLNLPLIDAENAEWEQIIELRKDSEAKAKLRRLRLFLNANYDGKSRGFVEDDLLCRIDEYDAARRSLGFNAVTSSLGILLDSKNIQAAASAGLAGMLLGSPVAGLSASAIIEVGQFSLELARQRHSIREFENGHQLAYLVDSRSKFGGDSDVGQAVPDND